MTDRIIVTEYDVFCGMDVDKKSIVAAFLNWQGGLKKIRLPYCSKALVAYVRRKLDDKERIVFVYEAGPTGFGLRDDLEAAKYRCLVAAPSMVPKAPGERVKTNRLDAVRLATNLRGGQIEGIQVPDMLYRDLRHLVQWRDACVKETGRRQRRIKSLLLLEGLEFPGERWDKQTGSKLQEMECRPVVSYKLKRLLNSLKNTQEEGHNATLQLRLFYEKDEELSRNIEYLTSVSGVGFITATHFLARVGDWRQLGSVKETCGFMGLGTTEDSTGDRVSHGSITGVGDRRLRAKLIQCAWRAIRDDEDLRQFYLRIYLNNPKQFASKKAIVAVARKIVSRMHAVLKGQRPYVAEGYSRVITN